MQSAHQKLNPLLPLIRDGTVTVLAVPVTVKQTDSNVVVLSGVAMVLYRKPLEMMAATSPIVRLRFSDSRSCNIKAHVVRRYAMSKCNVFSPVVCQVSVRRKTSQASSSIVLPIVLDLLPTDLAFSIPNFTERRRPGPAVGTCLADRTLYDGGILRSGRTVYDGRTMNGRWAVLRKRSMHDGQTMLGGRSMHDGRIVVNGRSMDDGRTVLGGRCMHVGQTMNGRWTVLCASLRDGRFVRDR